ncbi:hypothetical protein C7M84_022502 [Penaeus vannamei]|uniref:Uncharacterized protein n=1 Tax=Penaeus vannamei TaxID=6689 RepID=A0A3R7QZ55_PENVA|nr:hypothetical protein C7M84_022502 [Penaeus vannamei]
MPGRGRPLRATRSSSQPSSRTSSPDHRASLIVVQGSNTEVQDAVRAMEGEVTIMEEMVQRMTELIAQNREELLRRMEEMARTSEDRLQRLEDHLQGRTAPTEAVVSRSNGSQVPSAVQPEEPPADAPLPHNRQDLTTCARSSSPIHVATREDLQEWQRQEKGKGVFNDKSGLSRTSNYRDTEGRKKHSLGFLTCVRLDGLFPSQPQDCQLPYAQGTAMSQQRVTFDTSSLHWFPEMSSLTLCPETRSLTLREKPLLVSPEEEPGGRELHQGHRKPGTAHQMTHTSVLRERAVGRAETIINSESFDGNSGLGHLQAALRRKFRGTYTASDFFKVLYDHAMTERQAPMDFFLEVEASVFQGYRDHRGAVGEPSELIRRVFLAGLPSTLRDLLVLKDDCSPIQLAKPPEAWNSRYGIRHSSSTLATSLQTTPRGLPASTSHSRPTTPYSRPL